MYHADCQGGNKSRDSSLSNLDYFIQKWHLLLPFFVVFCTELILFYAIFCLWFEYLKNEKLLSVLFNNTFVRGLFNCYFHMWADIKAFNSGRCFAHIVSYFSQYYCVLTIWINLNSGGGSNNFNTVRDSYYIGSNGRMMIINWKEYGKNCLLPDLRYCPFIHLKG